MRHLIGHVDVVGALWKMICNVSNASQHVILQLMFSATHVPFALEESNIFCIYIVQLF